MTDTTNEEVLDEITPFTDEADREIARAGSFRGRR